MVAALWPLHMVTVLRSPCKCHYALATSFIWDLFSKRLLFIAWKHTSCLYTSAINLTMHPRKKFTKWAIRCGHPGCGRLVANLSGLTQHMQASHCAARRHEQYSPPPADREQTPYDNAMHISKTTTSLAFEFCLFVVFDFIMQLLLLLNKLTCLLLFTLISFTFTLYFWDFWDLTSRKHRESHWSHFTTAHFATIMTLRSSQISLYY